jgi:hypothetical protein
MEAHGDELTIATSENYPCDPENWRVAHLKAGCSIPTLGGKESVLPHQIHFDDARFKLSLCLRDFIDTSRRRISISSPLVVTAGS